MENRLRRGLMSTLKEKFFKRYFTYHELLDMALFWFQKARVEYMDGKTSIVMSIGNAFEYRDTFGGQVISS